MIHPGKKMERDLCADEDAAELELVGETCFHVDFPDFRCKVLRVDDGRAHVKVLSGWRGPRLPKEPVPVPTAKLERSL